jgi:hypothetical protein
MNLPNIVDVAKSQAQFIHYCEGALWYRVRWVDGLNGVTNFDFPVPIDDAGGGYFLAEMKGLALLRWVRKHITTITEAEKQQEILSQNR